MALLASGRISVFVPDKETGGVFAFWASCAPCEAVPRAASPARLKGCVSLRDANRSAGSLSTRSRHTAIAQVLSRTSRMADTPLKRVFVNRFTNTITSSVPVAPRDGVPPQGRDLGKNRRRSAPRALRLHAQLPR